MKLMCRPQDHFASIAKGKGIVSCTREDVIEIQRIIWDYLNMVTYHDAQFIMNGMTKDIALVPLGIGRMAIVALYKNERNTVVLTKTELKRVLEWEVPEYISETRK